MIGVKIVFSIFCVGIIALTGMTLYIFTQNKKIEKLRSRSACLLPPHPSNGWWSLDSHSTSKVCVPTGTILQVYCNESFILNKENTSICINGNWFPQIGECLQTCPSMYSTSMVKMNCFYDNKKMKNCENALEDTRVQYFCPSFYEDERRQKFKGICKNGRWSEGPPSCVPICGRNGTEILNPLIINGTISKKGEFPWQVAIYNRNKFRCGGVLLHEKLILTAAHCFAPKVSLSDYTVIVGNLNTQYTKASQEENAQISSLQNITIYEGYQGTSPYKGDIAIIVPTKTFHLSVTVCPICIDWTKEYEQNKKMGIVSGWGSAMGTRSPSEQLRKLEVPLFSYKDCRDMLSNFSDFSDDKLCAGYINQSKSACTGDSGSGLIFDHFGRYYLIGIVSVGFKARTESGGCNIETYTLYTQISKYLETFIEDNYQKYKPPMPSVYEKSPTDLQETSSRTSTLKLSYTTIPPPSLQRTRNDSFARHIVNSTCVLPTNPRNGKWEIYSGNKKSGFGEFVNSGTFLKIICDSHYKLDGDHIIACENGSWSSPMGQCLMMCPTLVNTTNMNIYCYYAMGKLKNCNEPVQGTYVHFYCAQFYEEDKKVEHLIYCNNGNWKPSKPKCVPKCGHKITTDMMSTTNDNELEETVFPWVLTIYNKQPICMGTLLSENLVVTSRDCLKKNETYVIMAGRKTISDISSLIKHRKITINDIKIKNFLAFVFLKEPFQLSRVVQPVCLNWDDKLTHFENAYISGWNYMQNYSMEVSNVRHVFQCSNVMPETYVNMTNEKSCVRYESEDASMYINNGGGGVFIKHQSRVFLVGVLDVLNSTEKFSKFRTYTPIYEYMDDLQTSFGDAEKFVAATN